MALQIRRGSEATRTSITPVNGEPIYSSDTKKLFVGDGTTAGGVTLGYFGRIEVSGQTALSAADNKDTLTVVAGSNVSVTTDETTNSITISTESSVVEFDNGSINIFQNNITGLNSNEDINLEPSGTGKFIVTGNSDIVGDLTVTGTINGTLTGNVNGNLSGNVDGNVTGTVTGNIFTSLIDSSDSSPIAVTPTMIFSSDVEVENNLSVSGNINLDGETISAVNGAIETNSRLRIIDRQTTLSAATFYSVHDGSSTERSFLSFARTRGTYESQTSVQSGDIIYQLGFSSYDGSSFSNSCVIRGVVDPDGVVSPGAVPGKLEFWTTDDAGNELTRVTIDKNGRLISLGQFWAVTSVPTGLPIYALANTDVSSAGSRVAMRRSRGTFDLPTSVQSGDNLFRLMWGGHDGTSYRDTASIEGNVSDVVSLGIIPTDLTIKTTTTAGALTVAAKFTDDQILQVDKISALSGGSIDVQSNITSTAITVSNFVKFPVYSDPSSRDTAIPSPEAGMVVFLTDSTGSGGAPKLQVNTNSTTGGWVDL